MYNRKKFCLVGFVGNPIFKKGLVLAFGWTKFEHFEEESEMGVRVIMNLEALSCLVKVSGTRQKPNRSGTSSQQFWWT